MDCNGDTMKRSGIRPNTGIRSDLKVLHQTRVAAVIARKTAGQWLDDGIREKIEREGKSGQASTSNSRNVNREGDRAVGC